MWDILDLSAKGPSLDCNQCWGDTEMCTPLDYTVTTLSQDEPIDLSMNKAHSSRVIKPNKRFIEELGERTSPENENDSKNTKKVKVTSEQLSNTENMEDPPNKFPPTPPSLTPASQDSVLYKGLTDSPFVDNLIETENPIRYSCPFCKKQFIDKNSFSIHQQLTANETNKFACCECNKVYTEKRTRNSHRRSHIEKKVFLCQFCMITFSRQNLLSRHVAYHNNLERFSCKYCNRAFSRSDVLKAHVLKHENRMNYHCKICDKYFRGQLSLNNHQRRMHS